MLLLEKLGYRKSQKDCFHLKRKAVFIRGDHGPNVREALHLVIVSNIVKQKYAYIVLGNHEYHLLAYCTASSYKFLNADHKISQGMLASYLRERSERHYQTLAQSLE